MRVGIIGLGKLGLPVAITIAHKGHGVIGYDPNPAIKGYLNKKHLPYVEANIDGKGDINDLFKTVDVKFGSVKKVVEQSELILVAVQTPHDPMYEGHKRMPNSTKDFNYSYLIEAVKSVSDEVAKLGEERVVVVVSTVLPGTLARDILPIIDKNVKLTYSPQFIAMGTVVRDFLNPENNLVGRIDKSAEDKLIEFYKSINSAPLKIMSLESAEFSKVAYNTFITRKINFANQVMEICHKIPNANADDVMDFIKSCKERLISDKYLNGGMGDSGPCHPRDNIALSDLAKRLDLKYDMARQAIICREKQTEFLAELIEERVEENPDYEVYLLGYTYKVETNLTTGSCGTLLHEILKEKGIHAHLYDPYVDGWVYEYPTDKPAIFFISMNHAFFKTFNYPLKSIIIDPWRYLPPIDNCTVIGVGT